MKLSIVIIALNEEAVLSDCLRYVSRHGFFEVIVVDNGSSDRTSEIAKYWKAKVIIEPRRGVTWARKAGFDASIGDIVAFIDADTRMPNGWIDRVVHEFDDINVVAVSGPCHFYDAPWHVRTMATLFNAITWMVARCGAPMLQGGNFAVRRSALERAGQFNTDIEFYGEETDVAMRIAKVGTIHYRWRIWMDTSGRRLMSEGAIKVGITYALNYLSTAFMGRPITKTHQDIRITF